MVDETPREPAMVWHFVRRHFLRIVISAVLVAAAYGVVSIYATYLLELRIAEKIESHGGEIYFDWVGPDWISQSVQDRLPYLNRICAVHLSDDAACVELLSELGSLTNLDTLGLFNTLVTDAGLVHLKGLTNLTFLRLDNTQVTDAGLVHLKGLTSLTFLFLDNTQVTDAGLEHLKGLTNLTYLRLDNTQVTDAGLEHLKGLINLNELVLSNTQVTDDGLEHLKGLTNLELLDLSETETIPDGRDMLRKALPNCSIEPAP